MRSAFIAAFTFFAFASSVSAASLHARQNVPTCGITCLQTADLGGCASDDNACLCNNSAFVASTTQCIQSSCSGSDLQAAESFAQQTCLAVGVTLTNSAPLATNTVSTTSPSSSGTSSPSPTSNAAFVSGASLNHLAAAGALGIAALLL